MVRIKHWAKKGKPPSNPLVIISDSSSGSISFICKPPSVVDLDWCQMAKKKKSDQQVVTRIYTKDQGSGQSCVTPDGYWVDSKYMFLRRYEVDETFFYRDHNFSYKHRQPEGIPEPYDQARLDATFSGMVLSEVPYPLANKYEKCSKAEMDDAVRGVFHLGPEI